MITIPSKYFEDLRNAIENAILLGGTFEVLSKENEDYLLSAEKSRDLVDQIETFIFKESTARKEKAINAIQERFEELEKLLKPFGAQMDFIGFSDNPDGAIKYLSLVNSGFEAFVYYLEKLRDSLCLDIIEIADSAQSSQPKTSKKTRKEFHKYFLPGYEYLPEVIKKEYPGIRGLPLRQLLESLVKNECIVIEIRGRQALYEAMKEFFEHDIAAKSAIFDPKDPQNHEDFKVIDCKLRALIQK